jgi:hypothetical protein
LRLSEPGFASLVAIVVSQQVSRASADAILGRFIRLLDPLTPRAVLDAPEDVFREAGLSRPKQRTVLALAQAVEEGLDLVALAAWTAREPRGRSRQCRASVPGRRKSTCFSQPGIRIFSRQRTWRCKAPSATRWASTRVPATRRSPRWPNHGRLGGASLRACSGPITAK